MLDSSSFEDGVGFAIKPPFELLQHAIFGALIQKFEFEHEKFIQNPTSVLNSPTFKTPNSTPTSGKSDRFQKSE